MCALTGCESHIDDAALKNSIMSLNFFKKSEHCPQRPPLKASSLAPRLSVNQSGAPGTQPSQPLASALPLPQGPAQTHPMPLPLSSSSVLQTQLRGLQRGPSPGLRGPRVSFSPPLSMGLSRQEYWSGLPCPPPGHLPNPGIKPRSPELQADSLPSEPPGKPLYVCIHKSHKRSWLSHV